MRDDFDSPGQLNVKTRVMLVLNILSRFCVLRRFSVDLGFSVVIHTRIHHYFSSFFLSLTCKSPIEASWPLSTKLSSSLNL